MLCVFRLKFSYYSWRRWISLSSCGRHTIWWFSHMWWGSPDIKSCANVESMLWTNQISFKDQGHCWGFDFVRLQRWRGWSQRCHQNRRTSFKVICTLHYKKKLKIIRDLFLESIKTTVGSTIFVTWSSKRILPPATGSLPKKWKAMRVCLCWWKASVFWLVGVDRTRNYLPLMWPLRIQSYVNKGLVLKNSWPLTSTWYVLQPQSQKRKMAATSIVNGWWLKPSFAMGKLPGYWWIQMIVVTVIIKLNRLPRWSLLPGNYKKNERSEQRMVLILFVLYRLAPFKIFIEDRIKDHDLDHTHHQMAAFLISTFIPLILSQIVQ